MFIAIFLNPDARCGFCTVVLLASASTDMLKASVSYTESSKGDDVSASFIFMRLLSSYISICSDRSSTYLLIVERCTPRRRAISALLNPSGWERSKSSSCATLSPFIFPSFSIVATKMLQLKKKNNKRQQKKKQFVAIEVKVDF